MDLFVKLTTFLSLISYCTSTTNSAVLKENATSYYTGILSDVLYTNRENDLKITAQCNHELITIQNGLDMRDTWAIKRKCFHAVFHISRTNSIA